MTALQFFWFFLIGLLFAGFFFLEGFDFGVGMAVQTLAHNEHEKDQIVETIGPVWDGNEVWLLTAGGAMFASFPYWYASLFSGYYLILLTILCGLIIRGVSFEFRHKVPAEQKNIWNWTLTIGSALVPFFFGVMFISLIQGVPLDAKGNMMAHFGDYINLFSLVGGVAVLLLSYLHGLNYISLKTTGPVRYRARNYAAFLYWVLYLGLLVFALLLFLKTDFFSQHALGTLVLLVVIVALSLFAHASVFKQHEMSAFIASGLTFVALVALLFQGLFPRVMISSISSKYDLLIQNASSSPYTLKIMSIVAISLVPFVLAYTVWAYYIFRKRISLPVIVTGDK
ncbi:cytochrome d ubiquinol oxidase subunit II [Streptococcus dysgalactiae subsp. dysgalactiae]|uniref:Cytochrome d ubiquinol oxidase subunit II n=1 Tax=Streptococcus dysgalactiae subsp. dysgalactiae TaxID=99822 RepID=A0A380JYW9_STRDY|nr:cytochrome d ubiquinol oxidase subunit II [Streptococcus dysgalactiae]MCB2833861.1 cytochrome d ubiquinol oxidase subunit II [Streptococcus dysgalactiae subsp. dysgalactiae]MCB2841664.1 cytochrome d ubiquinol oxidase subunit II [Streptococcus dysgalactiae subsp. dysgalactiae]MCB2845461.1 cytochrome d ubiquinol oxidase subunit II [Streptococcus dysgalactiae subsp. dysgalactiae]SUN51878.1 cytochrome d ubiquinol oxidase subunit II [Streptococcus dysgalactiae subsp. dysgalactiae]